MAAPAPRPSLAPAAAPTVALFLALLALPLTLAVPAPAGASAGDPEPWVLVDTRAHTLAVIQDGRPRRVFRNIALGRGGVARLRRRGDGATPLGEYHIAWINRNSRFHIFLGLDYPNAGLAREALAQGLIDRPTYEAIRHALAAGRVPPQGTALGGYLGIHGLGRGDPLVHARFNWTQGCIALTNEEIEELARWVRVGTRVLIR